MTVSVLKTEHIKILAVKAQLHQLMMTALANKNQLDVWQNLIDEYRTLQMDDIITDDDEDDEDINQSIDLIEEHIGHSRIVIYDIVDRIHEFNTRIESIWINTD